MSRISTSSLVSHEREEDNFPSGLHAIKDFLVGRNHHWNFLASCIFPSRLHTIKDFHIGQDYQEGSLVGH